MMRLDVRGDITPLIRDLSNQSQKQVPFATALALTRTAKFAAQKIKEEMPRVFNAPTAFTLNSLYVRTATKANLSAEVKIKDEAFKAMPPLRWLSPEVYGGGREPKRFETLLRARGILGAGQFVMPAVGAKLDSKGNVSRGQIQQILSQLGASFDVYQRQTARSKKRNKRKRQFFALRVQRGKLKPGIYERIGFAWVSSVKPVFIFTGPQRYKKRLRFYEIADQTAQMRFPIEFALAMRQAIASSYN